MDCRGCRYYHNIADNHCLVCDGSGYTRPSNADRLRSMSDEEFATAICKHDGCPFRKTEDNECLKHHYDCKACWIDWLKQEVSND